MKLYLIRHGESENNLNGRWTGWHQAELTEKGRADARRAGELLKPVSFDKVYSSDLIRAVDTCRLALGTEPEQTPLLREINVGKLQNKTKEESERLYGEQLKIARASGCYDLLGGESVADLQARLGEFLDSLAGKPYERVAAFCHNGAVLGMLDLVYGITLPRGKAFTLNGAITVLENQAGVWKLRLFNYTGELE